MSKGNSGAVEVAQGMRLEDAPSASAPPEPQEELKPVEGVNPRAAALEAIYARRNQVLEDELAHSSEIPITNAPQADEVILESATPAEGQEGVPGAGKPPADGAASGKSAAPADGAAPQAGEPAPAPQKHKIVVNGQEFERTTDELIADAQRVNSADQRWMEAAAMRQAAQQIIYGHMQAQPPQGHPAAQGAPSQVSAPQPRQSATEAIDVDTAKKFAQRLNYGSEQEQIDAIRDLVSTVVSNVQAQPAQVGVDPQLLVQQATQNALAAISYQHDLQTVGSEFPDVFSDALMSKTAGNYANELAHRYAQAGIHKRQVDVFREALQFVSEKYLKKESAPAAQDPTPASSHPVQAAPATPATTQVTGDRIERKRAAPQPPAAANRVASEAAPQQQRSSADIVNWMRQKRHQPVIS